MGIYIGIKKLDETNEIVSYMFDMRIIENKYYKPGELFAYKVDSRNAYGFCTINKNTGEFILDKEGTDPYYLTEDMGAVFRVQVILKRIFESGEPFPDKTCFAS